MNIFRNNPCRSIALSLGITFLFTSMCSAIQRTGPEFDDQRFISSLRQVESLQLDPAQFQEMLQSQFGRQMNRPNTQDSIFGSTFFGPAVPYGTNYSARSPIPTPPVVKRLPKETIKSPFASFSSLVPTSAAANHHQVQAEENFRLGNYSLAVQQVEQVLIIDDRNGQLYMFAALSNIAAGNFEKSGRLFSTATHLLDVKEWQEMFSNTKRFYGKDDWAKHRRNLDEYCRQHPMDVDTRQLHGYLTLISKKASGTIKEGS